jgi:ubiquinone/menaquinone biosynthesis C-methylase UbiE
MSNNEVKDIWNANAAFWDYRMGEGNAYHKILIEPVQLKMLDIRAGQEVLDIACGNGQFARKMASLGARVTAVDFSENFIAIARAKGGGDIDYRVMDVSSAADMETLSSRNFDSIVCTMALMDMENIMTLISYLPRMLKKGGVCVFSVMHPCFHSGDNVLVHEYDEEGGEARHRYGVRISNYLVEKSSLGIGMAGQPRPQIYFHRPLSTILSYFFQNGFMLDALEEPSFKDIEKSNNINENVFRQIPPVLICRLRIFSQGAAARDVC